MTEYTDGFRARMVERMTGPKRMSANALSQEVGVHQPTLSRWLRASSHGHGATPSQGHGAGETERTTDA
jgi:transposase-like protein